MLYIHQRIGSSQRGALLIETILAGAIFALVVTTLVGAYLAGQESTALAGARERASHLADEGVEAVRNIRDDDFSSLVDGTYGLDPSSGEWMFSGTQDVTDIFTRQVEVSSIDTDTRQIVSTVTWRQNAQRTGEVAVTTYLTNWVRSFAGAPDWTNPAIESTVNLAGNDNGIKIQTEGDYAYVVRNSGIPEFAVIDISNTALPVEVGTVGVSGVPNNIAINGNYAYLATSGTELQVVDISVPSSPTVVGGYNLSGNANAFSITGFGTTIILGRNGGELHIFDVSTPSLPTIIGTYDANNHVYDVDLGNGNQYVFAATRQNNEEFQLIDISTPSAPIEVSRLNVQGRLNGIAYNASKDRAIGAGTGNTSEVVIIMPQ